MGCYNIVHITPHLGGGVGTVILDWLKLTRRHYHSLISLDYINDKAKKIANNWGIAETVAQIPLNHIEDIFKVIMLADIVVMHWWDHPMLYDLCKNDIPPCRLVAWCHKNYKLSDSELKYPDLFLGTSPIQAQCKQHIWSTGDMLPFRHHMKVREKSQPFTIGFVGTAMFKKMHSDYFVIANEIDNARFLIVGDKEPAMKSHDNIEFTGKVDNVIPYLEQMDVFLYLLRPDHYGTCEQTLGEAMSMGIVPIIWDNACERQIILSEDGFCGYRVNSIEDCIRYIEHLKKNADPWRSYLSLSAKDRAKELYDINHMIGEWDDVFEIMSKQPKRERKVLVI